MKDITTWSNMNPLTIKMTGSGEYVKTTCANLPQMFQDAEYDNIEEKRMEAEDRSELEDYDD